MKVLGWNCWADAQSACSWHMDVSSTWKLQLSRSDQCERTTWSLYSGSTMRSIGPYFDWCKSANVYLSFEGTDDKWQATMIVLVLIAGQACNLQLLWRQWLFCATDRQLRIWLDDYSSVYSGYWTMLQDVAIVSWGWQCNTICEWQRWAWFAKRSKRCGREHNVRVIRSDIDQKTMIATQGTTTGTWNNC
jgi:hypothetical protein